MAKALILCALSITLGYAVTQGPYGEIPDTRLWQAAPGDTPFKNILSIDGGGIRGIIPVQVIDYLEKETYKYALAQGYI